MCTTVLVAWPASAMAASASGSIALRAALEMIGVPYSWGGGGVHGPGYGIGRGARTKGFDCSGLAEYAYARAGILIGTTTTEQWRSGVRVAQEVVEPGDLVFYDNDPKRPGPEHVGLALDGERMVHAPHTGALVRIDSLDRPDLLGVVRPDLGRGHVEE
ncbi:cell wall-associated NlpC family hydrolase [Nonomuraea thailandensis]|uniref:Cell wall-associated NlpC family hydrolase n=1 Tax=Nonomuraea thailandensis TaxID=1188745 RepID=A0A9X2GTE7_9ACTN|nr:C40 family peptidase [Nonomuraea thailandensis]MCP2363590.1 cell wall-associated NlpC family hydrolase [Nonomuraea thailandensis]